MSRNHNNEEAQIYKDELARYANFEDVMEELGQNAISLKEAGGLEFNRSLQKLYEYCKDGLLFYLLAKYTSSPVLYFTDYSDNAGAYEKHNKFRDVDILRDYAIEEINKDGHKWRYERELYNSVIGFDKEKTAKTDRPFYSFFYKKLFFNTDRIIQEGIRAQRAQGKANVLTYDESNLGKKVKKLMEGEELFSLDKAVQVVAKATGKKESTVREAFLLMGKNVISYDSGGKDDDEADRSLIDTLEDADSGLIYNDVLEDERVSDVLFGFIDKIIRESFEEIHKAVFPSGFTKELVDCIVSEYKAEDESYKSAVDSNWDEISLDIEERKEDYAGKSYLCIKIEIFDWFETIRRQITSKMIAERLHISASYYSKIYDSAICLIRKNKNKYYE